MFSVSEIREAAAVCDDHAFDIIERYGDDGVPVADVWYTASDQLRRIAVRREGDGA